MIEIVSKYVQETLFDVCTLPDLKRMGKIRGFKNMPAQASKIEAAEYISSLYLSSFGLEAAFIGLEEKELRVLHALRCAKEPKSISDLAPFLGEKDYCSDSTIKKLFLILKDKLVSRGILLLKSRTRYSGRDSKWRQYDLLFPTEFYSYLPPLKMATVEMKSPVSFSCFDSFVRGRFVKNLCNEPEEGIYKEFKFPSFQVDSGKISLGHKTSPSWNEIRDMFLQPWFYYEDISTLARRFSARDLRSSIRRYVLASIPKGFGVTKEVLIKTMTEFSIPFIEKELESFISIGLLLGFLGKRVQENVEYFIPNIQESAPSSTFLLQCIEEKDRVKIIMKEGSSFEQMIFLSQVSKVCYEENFFFLQPCIKEIGRDFAKHEENVWIKKLLSSSSIFQNAFERVREQRGKLVLHQGLKIIKLNGLDAEGVVLHAYKEKVTDLGQGYYAVAEENFLELLAYGKKKGLIPKFINA